MLIKEKFLDILSEEDEKIKGLFKKTFPDGIIEKDNYKGVDIIVKKYYNIYKPEIIFKKDETELKFDDLLNVKNKLSPQKFFEAFKVKVDKMDLAKIQTIYLKLSSKVEERYNDFISKNRED